MDKKTINLLGIRKRVVLSHFKDKVQMAIVMEEISEEDETAIDEHKIFETSVKQIVSKDSVVSYGELDFSKEQEINYIADKIDIGDNSYIYSNFDYDEGVAYANDENKIMQYPTSDAKLWLKFNHCLLGKPKRVIIYKVAKKFLFS